MNKIQKIIVSGLITLLLCYFITLSYAYHKYHHRIEMERFDRFLWLFTKEAQRNIDTTYYVSCIKEKDILCQYYYKDYDIFIWEFKDLDLDPTAIPIKRVIDLDKINFNYKEILNKKSIPEINIKYGFSLDMSMKINLNNASVLEKSFESPHYKGFYGTVNLMSISAGGNKQQLYFDYKNEKKPTMLLLYRRPPNLYVIVINSESPFKEDIINIFNLN